MYAWIDFGSPLLRPQRKGTGRVAAFERHPDRYERLDWKCRDDNFLTNMSDLRGSLFWNKSEKKVEGVVSFGKGLEGWPGCVHGGCSATIADTLMGMCVMKYDPMKLLRGMVLTANLNVNYRKVIKTGSSVYVESWVEREEGKRKIWVRFRISECSEMNARTTEIEQHNLTRVDLDEKRHQPVVLVEGEGLFIRSL